MGVGQTTFGEYSSVCLYASNNIVILSRSFWRRRTYATCRQHQRCTRVNAARE
jgi:hypothetical protein